MKFSSALHRVPASASTQMAQRAREMRANGIDVISLSLGQPDFDTPEHIKDAAIVAMQRGETGYPPIGGTPALKEAIRADLATQHAINVAPENILVANGGKQVLFNALVATVDVGDEVIIPAPYWVSYPDIVTFTGGTPIILPTQQSDDFVLKPAQLEAAITSNTRWLMLNSPCNPTGSVYSEQELADLAAVLMKHPHVGVICDDIYEHLVYGGRVRNLLAIEPALTDRTLLVNGVSKAWCMTGWRIGWGVGPTELIQAMTKLQSQSTSGACSISQAAAVAALTGDQSHIPEHNAAYEERRDYVVHRINAIDELSCVTPTGAFYVYIDCNKLIGQTTAAGKPLIDDGNIADALLDEAHVAAVQGAAFGLSPYIRASYATDMKSLETALDRIEQFCTRLS